jgi:fructose-1,6-bisphosphatase I
VQGEEQKKLDVITNDVLKRALKFTGKVGIIASEEEDKPVFNQDAYRVPGGEGKYQDVLADIGTKYVTVFDPLDGSSNVDANIPTGTIFGVYEETESMENCMVGDDTDEVDSQCIFNTLQPGSSLVASGYCLYSSSCIFVFTVGNGVNGFTYDRSIGEFVLTHPNMQVPKRGKIYSFNEANRWLWDKPLQEYITALQTGENEMKSQYSARYIGSMVGDVHRTLLYGGIFGYPSDTKNKDGKLRLLYEAAPMALLMEQAGGMALTGKTRILDLPPQAVHQRVPFLAGSSDDVLEMKSYYDASEDPEIIKRCLARLEDAKKA